MKHEYFNVRIRLFFLYVFIETSIYNLCKSWFKDSAKYIEKALTAREKTHRRESTIHFRRPDKTTSRIMFRLTQLQSNLNLFCVSIIFMLTFVCIIISFSFLYIVNKEIGISLCCFGILSMMILEM